MTLDLLDVEAAQTAVKALHRIALQTSNHALCCQSELLIDLISAEYPVLGLGRAAKEQLAKERHYKQTDTTYFQRQKAHWQGMVIALGHMGWYTCPLCDPPTALMPFLTPEEDEGKYVAKCKVHGKLTYEQAMNKAGVAPDTGWVNPTPSSPPTDK